ncbi:MAG: hypothetical protein V1493_01945 [Candidatus Diapherotrites archaeon]
MKQPAKKAVAPKAKKIPLPKTIRPGAIREVLGRRSFVARKYSEHRLKNALAAIEELKASRRVPENARTEACESLERMVEESKPLPFDSRAYFLGQVAEFARGISRSKLQPNTPFRGLGRIELLFSILKPETGRAGKMYRLRFKRSIIVANPNVFPPLYPVKEVFVLYSKGVGEIGFFRFDAGEPNEIAVEFIQGIPGAGMRRAEKLLGIPWYEAICEKLIAGHKPALRRGLQLRLPYYPVSPVDAKNPYRKDSPVYSKIRDRYLHPGPKTNPYLNPNRKRVQELLEEDLGLLPKAK